MTLPAPPSTLSWQDSWGQPPSRAATVLRLTDLQLLLGGRSLGPISLRVEAGEQIALLGPRAAGKSMLLGLIAGDLAPCRGQLTLDGRPLANWRAGERLQRCALLPQGQKLAWGLSVERMVALGRRARDESTTERRRIVQAALTQAGVAHLSGARPGRLSAAERAQVQLARLFAQAWDTRAGLMLMDEPPQPLPAELNESLLRTAGEFARQRDHALVAVLHDLDLAFMQFERLWLLKAGRLLADCDAVPATWPLLAQLYDTPLHLQPDARGQAAHLDAAMRFAPSPTTPQ